MQRPVAIHGEEIGDIHQKADRPQTDGPQRLLQPIWAWAIFNPANDAAAENWTAVQRILIN